MCTFDKLSKKTDKDVERAIWEYINKLFENPDKYFILVETSLTY